MALTWIAGRRAPARPRGEVHLLDRAFEVAVVVTHSAESLNMALPEQGVRRPCRLTPASVRWVRARDAARPGRSVPGAPAPRRAPRAGRRAAASAATARSSSAARVNSTSMFCVYARRTRSSRASGRAAGRREARARARRAIGLAHPSSTLRLLAGHARAWTRASSPGARWGPRTTCACEPARLLERVRVDLDEVVAVAGDWTVEAIPRRGRAARRGGPSAHARRRRRG